ncbi:MAG: hypothetical protein JNM84_06640 [Planctomycetes bacterium]|nr:hypothetical protein [Planctomycetota bacterium]
MRPIARTFPSLAVLGLCVSLAAQAPVLPDNGGSGADGVFAPATNVTLDTAVQALYEFTSVTIPAGVVVNVIGPRPLAIRSIGPVIIDGELRGSGQIGSTGGNNLPGGAGGAGGPGGGRGGDGGCMPAAPFSGNGSDGAGRRPGTGGQDLFAGSFGDSGGGGGGGNATAGADAPTTNQPTPGLQGRGGLAGLCRAGAGGGGGACDVDSQTVSTSNDGGGGGGGGGGRITITSNSGITLGAGSVLRCDGGAGGLSNGNGGSGGGGAGGMIELAAPSITANGVASAVGGPGGAIGQAGATTPGGAGGDGCIFAIGALSGAGTFTPTPSVRPLGLLLTNVAAGGSINIVPLNPANTVFTGLAEATLPGPIPFLGGQLFIDPTGTLFPLSFGQATLGPIAGLTGAAGARTIQVNSSAALLFPGLELDVYVQGFLAQLPNFTGISDLGIIYFKY